MVKDLTISSPNHNLFAIPQTMTFFDNRIGGFWLALRAKSDLSMTHGAVDFKDACNPHYQ